MAKRIPKTKPPAPVEEHSVPDREDPTWRFDILLARIVERVVERSQDVTLMGYYRRCREQIDHCLAEWFGPLALERRVRRALGSKRPRRKRAA